jgi:hypothetical protein
VVAIGKKYHTVCKPYDLKQNLKPRGEALVGRGMVIPRALKPQDFPRFCEQPHGFQQGAKHKEYATEGKT